ncbi:MULTISPECIES: YjgN family protein [unclassified Luteimonas]
MLEIIPTAPEDGAETTHLPETVCHRPQFSGTAGEYFGIWIVNVVLTILTLGIYSAWAKVRTERYFYANTRIDGSSFEYLADPIRILKGRLVAYAVVAALVVSSQSMPVLYMVLILLLWLCAPLIVCLAVRFRARYSAWRGVRFGFDATVGSAYGPFLGWVVLAGVTLGVLSPIAKRKQHAWLARGHRFGSARFAYDGRDESYYRPWLVAVGLGFVLAVVVAVVFGVVFAGLGAEEGSEPDVAAVQAAVMIPMAVFYLGLFGLLTYLRTRQVNLLWNHSTLSGVRFTSTLRVRDVAWLYFSNLVAILCTLGLATPWAMIRLARYRADHLMLESDGGLAAFSAAVGGERGAVGAEMVDALDMGLDIGL